MAPAIFLPQPTEIADDVVTKLLADIDKALVDQPSCRLLQKKLEEEKEETRMATAKKLFSKMLEKIVQYMNLPFGNYLCQKLFELLTEAQLAAVLSKVQPNVVAVSNNLHGTRSIQKLLERAASFPLLRGRIVEMMKGHVEELIKVTLNAHWCRT